MWNDKYEIVTKTAKAFFWHPSGVVKEVTIIDCDFDKRVEFLYEDGTKDEYKWGYFYGTVELASQAMNYELNYIDWESSLPSPDCINPWKLLLSKRNYTNWLKKRRKDQAKNTSWYVHLSEYYEDSEDRGMICHQFKTFKRALKCFSMIDECVVKSAFLSDRDCNELAELYDKQVYVVEHENPKVRMLKSFHIGKCSTYKEFQK